MHQLLSIVVLCVLEVPAMVDAAARLAQLGSEVRSA
jgi:hypothetical protein